MIKKDLMLSAIPTLHSKTKDSHFVPIPTLRRDNSRMEPCQVRIPTSPDKVRIPTLSRTILELSRFLLCAEHIFSKGYFLKVVKSRDVC